MGLIYHIHKYFKDISQRVLRLMLYLKAGTVISRASTCSLVMNCNMETTTDLDHDAIIYYNTLLKIFEHLRGEGSESKIKKGMISSIGDLSSPAICPGIMQRRLLSPACIEVAQTYDLDRIMKSPIKAWVYRTLSNTAQEIVRKQVPLAKAYLIGRIRKSARQTRSRLTRNRPVAVKLVDDALNIIPYGIKLHKYVSNHRLNMLETGFYLLKELHNFKEIDESPMSWQEDKLQRGVVLSTDI